MPNVKSVQYEGRNVQIGSRRHEKIIEWERKQSVKRWRREQRRRSSK